MARELQGGAGRDFLRGQFALISRVRNHGVGVCPGSVRQFDLDRVRTAMEPDEKCLVGRSVRVVVREVHAERAPCFVAPVVLGHLVIPTAEPRNVLTPARLASGIEQELPVPEAVSPQDWALGA